MRSDALLLAHLAQQRPRAGRRRRCGPRPLVRRRPRARPVRRPGRARGRSAGRRWPRHAGAARRPRAGPGARRRGRAGARAACCRCTRCGCAPAATPARSAARLGGDLLLTDRWPLQDKVADDVEVLLTANSAFTDHPVATWRPATGVGALTVGSTPATLRRPGLRAGSCTGCCAACSGCADGRAGAGRHARLRRHRRTSTRVAIGADRGPRALTAVCDPNPARIEAARELRPGRARPRRRRRPARRRRASTSSSCRRRRTRTPTGCCARCRPASTSSSRSRSASRSRRPTGRSPPPPSAGLTLAVYQNRRWDADYLALKRAVRSGPARRGLPPARPSSAATTTRATSGTRDADDQRRRDLRLGQPLPRLGARPARRSRSSGCRRPRTSGSGTTSPTPTTPACCCTSPTASRRSSPTPTWPPCASRSSTCSAPQGGLVGDWRQERVVSRSPIGAGQRGPLRGVRRARPTCRCSTPDGSASTSLAVAAAARRSPSTASSPTRCCPARRCR